MNANSALLADEHDCLLLDLDGTVFRGSLPTPGAVETLSAIGPRTIFLTNNASRSVSEVADHLHGLGFTVDPDDIVTSAQTVARAVARQLPPGAHVLIVGTDSLAAEITNVGLRPVRSLDEAPVAVVQGHSTHTCWTDLAEAALAIRGGAMWTATNIDLTLPTERGLLPGNGSMVAALRAATGSEPAVVGKPGPTIMREAMTLGDCHVPLVVGDRLDTDIAGANAAGLPSLLVLTGVSTPADLIRAEVGQRPTYLAEDLRSLREPAASLRIGPQPGWHTEIGDGAVSITSTGQSDGLSAVRALAYAAWAANAPKLIAGDARARTVLERWAVS